MAKSEFGSAFEKAYGQGKGTEFTFKGLKYAAYKKGERPARKLSAFGEAFAAARKAQGFGGTFEYQGKKYTTNYAGEGTGSKGAGKSTPKATGSPKKTESIGKLLDETFPAPKNAGNSTRVNGTSPTNTSAGTQIKSSKDISVSDVLKPIGIGIGVGALALNRVPKNMTPMRPPRQGWDGSKNFFMGNGRNYATATVKEIKPKQLTQGTPRQLPAGDVPKQIHAGVKPPSRDAARNAVSRTNARAKPVKIKGPGFSMTDSTAVPKQSKAQYISKMAQGIGRRARGVARAAGAVGRVLGPAGIVYGGVTEALEYKRSKKGFRYQGNTLVNENGDPVS
jgi:hypothetical protein